MATEKIIECSICQDVMKPPIIICEHGHGSCGGCIAKNQIVNCPRCRGKMTKIRSYDLESLIENIVKLCKTPCYFVDKGCTFLLSQSEKEAHEAECRYRRFLCEGKRAAHWNCQWHGNYPDLYQHFKQNHPAKILNYSETNRNLKLNFDLDSIDVRIVSYYNCQQLFWYKCMIDTNEQMVYWTFQFVGQQKQAKKFYYEFEIFNNNQSTLRKFKIIEICENDVVDCREIFRKGRCVAVPFKTVKTFMDDNDEIFIKFRIIKMTQTTNSTQEKRR